MISLSNLPRFQSRQNLQLDRFRATRAETGRDHAMANERDCEIAISEVETKNRFEKRGAFHWAGQMS